MDISDLLAPEGVKLRAGASSKRQALHLAAGAAAQALGLNEAEVFEALMEREQLGSTGLGCGVAVPHARLKGLDRVTGVLVRLDQPVAYDSVDDRPVDVLFALFAPPSGGRDCGPRHAAPAARAGAAARAGPSAPWPPSRRAG